MGSETAKSLPGCKSKAEKSFYDSYSVKGSSLEPRSNAGPRQMVPNTESGLLLAWFTLHLLIKGAGFVLLFIKSRKNTKIKLII